MVQVRMEGFKKLQVGHNTDDLMRVIEKDDSNSSYTTDSEEGKNAPKTLRERTQRVIETKRFQIAICTLVLIDCCLVIVELLIKLKVLEAGGNRHVPLTVHYMSMAILCVFIVEILIRIFAIRLDFFRKKWEVFDGVVVILAFSLDIAFAKEEGLKSGIGLIIVLRLWRVSKILNGIINSVRKQAERRLLREQRTREALEQELAKYREYCSAQEFEIECLQGLLRKNGVDYGKVERPVMGQQIDVVVEVNEVSEKCALMQDTHTHLNVSDTST